MGALKDHLLGDRPATYPERPGHRGEVGGPSWRAAQSVAADAPTFRERIMASIRRAGVAGRTADEVAADLELKQPYSTRPRLAELNRTGEIRDSGRRRRGTSDLMQTVWIERTPDD